MGKPVPEIDAGKYLELNPLPMISFRRYIHLIRSDLYRDAGDSNLITFFRYMIFIPGYTYSFWMRTCAYLHGKPFFRYNLFLIARLILLPYSYKFGMDIPPRVIIDSGLYIGHFSGIIVHANARIGRNCNISQGVTIGIANRGIKKGCPIIGDNVFIGPGAKIIGGVKVGCNVAIGANCVVTHDVPDNAVIVGVPGKVISYEGAVGYIENTDYRKCCFNDHK
jgi:serine O-acetyltransferase